MSMTVSENVKATFENENGRFKVMFETMQKFSEQTGLSYSAIRKLALTNQLPYVMVGNRHMIHIEKGLAVLASLAERVGA